MNTQEALIAQVLNSRVTATEENVKLLEARLVAAVQTIQALRHEITLGRIERTRNNKDSAEKIVAGIRDEKEIVVPPELMVRKSKRVNREPGFVTKRWALWKVQYEAGYTVHQIARAWKCCRTSVEHARDMGFIPGYDSRKSK
jgi:hypothetical protein